MQESDKFKKDYSAKVQQLFKIDENLLMDNLLSNYDGFDFTKDDIPEMSFI